MILQNTLLDVTDELWISSTEQYFNKAFEVLNSYITYRGKHLLQTPKDYITQRHKIGNWHLEQHIKGKSTVGIFVNKVSKFLTFDIDLKIEDKEKYKRWVLYKVINALEEEGFGYHLNISFSGSKGYHIDLVFNNPIRVDLLKKLGEHIIKKYGLDKITLENGTLIAEVELRGCNNAGVKLPLVLNRKTNKFMYYLNDDLEPVTMDNFNSFELKILDTDTFYNLYSSCLDEILENNTKQIIINKKSETDKNNLEPKHLEYNKSELDYVIQNEILKNKGTRNNIIYLVALWCNGHKINKDEALEKLYRIIENTPEELFNDKTSLEWKYSECRTVIEKVYINNLVLFDIKEVAINKEILEFIMTKCKTLKQMNIFLTHIYHCIKWGNDDGIYFLSLNKIEEYTGATHKTIEKLNKQLIELGILEEVEKGYYIDLGNGMKKGIATTYKLTIPNDLLKSCKILLSDKIDFIKLCKKHLDKKTILKYIPKKTYYRNFT